MSFAEQRESDDDNTSSGLPNQVPYLLPPGPSNRTPNDGGLDQLREMFPGKSNSILQHALTSHRSVSQAALSLSPNVSQVVVDEDEEEDESLFIPTFSSPADSLEAVLKKLKKGLS